MVVSTSHDNGPSAGQSSLRGYRSGTPVWHFFFFFEKRENNDIRLVVTKASIKSKV